MPLLSLVLAVHREQGWLPELAASVLAQEGADLELVAVDDASPDHAPELLDELAERDARVRVRHLASRVGPGEARNIGLDLAEGDYVWFVRSPDLLPPGAAAAVAARLATGDADLLLLHHAREDVFGASRPGPHRALLERLAASGPGTLDDHPGLAAVAPQLWDKVLRRGFLRELGARFGSGGHGELSVTWPALLAAERIDALAAASYVRREPPNALREGSALDVFAQYDAVFDFADARVLAGRRLVPPAMLRHELALLGGLPPRERGEFFRRMSEAWNEHRRGDEPGLGGRGLELRARLVERGDHRAFRLFEESLELRHTLQPARLKSVRARAKRALKPRRNGLARHYRARLKEPIDPDLAVFAAYWYRGYACNPRAIYEKARELVPGFHGVWVVSTEGAHIVPDGVDYVMAGTREYFDAIARAKWLVNNVNFPGNVVKREGAVHVMTHHGTPLKRMGLDLRTTPDGGRRAGLPGLLRRCSRWDYSVSQNAFTTPIWERVYPTRYESLEVGYPRNDVLASPADGEVERVREALGIEPGRRAVLYAPTHREYQDEYVPTLDLAAVADGLGRDWIVLARAHYFHESDPLARELHRQGRVLDVSGHPSIEELCLAADVLVTDYSSIMFDYAVLDRPIVIHAPDWEEYRARRGTYFDLMAEPPGALTTSEAQLVEAFRSGAAWDEDASRLRTAFRGRFCYLDDGHAAERVVRRVWLGERAEAAAQAAAAVAR